MAKKGIPKKKSDVLVVVTTTGTEEQALDIAHHLVKHRMAACVNILPGVRSVFRWKGKINVDGEYMLVAKTIRSRFDDVRRAMRELNAYELPEILAFPASQTDKSFAAWVSECSTGESDDEDELLD